MEMLRNDIVRKVFLCKMFLEDTRDVIEEIKKLMLRKESHKKGI